MAFRVEPYIALRYLRSKRKEVFISIITVISVLGVALSVMVLNMVLAIMTGFESELQSKLINANEHILVRAYGGNLSDWQSVVGRINTVPGITGAFPFTYNQAMVSAEGASRGLVIRGVPDMPGARAKVEQVLAPGSSVEDLFQSATVEVARPEGDIDQVKLPTLIVGRELQRLMRVPIGSPVTVLSPQLSSSPQGLTPRMRRFVVAGSYSSGLSEYESLIAYSSLETAQNFFGMGDSVSGIEVQVGDLNRAPQIAKEILAAFGGAQSSPVYVTDWTESNRHLWEALKLEKKVYFYVLLLLIFIASFSIISTLVMLVMEKTRDIAVLKTIGATDSNVLWIFLIEGIIIGTLGTIFGTVFGYLGCVLLRLYGFPIDETVFALSTVPVHIIPSNFVTVAIAAFLITSLAGIYPAFRAAKLRPADALRFE